VRSPERKFTSEHYTDEHADAFAARYDDGVRGIKIDRVRRSLGDVRDKQALDLGCGIGYFASLVADLGASTVACDFAQAMVTRTRQRYGSKFALIRASVETLPFRAQTFDVVLALDVIEHLYHPVQMLQGVNNVLRPGGRLIITTDRVGFQIGGLQEYMVRVSAAMLRSLGFRGIGRRRDSRYQTPLCTHVREYRVHELIDLVEHVGFRITNFDTFPNRNTLGTLGHVVELLARGPLKRYKWGHCIYRFTRLRREDCGLRSEQTVRARNSGSIHLDQRQAITWFNVARWAIRTVHSDLRTYRRSKWRPCAPRLWGLLRPNVRRPVFLVGAPRSGTTFLGACLGELPEISYHFEPVATKTAARYVYEGRWGIKKAERFYRSVYAWLMRVHFDGDLVFAEKTPRNSFIIPFLYHCFPDARFIHIIRDGRDAALSMRNKPWLQVAQQTSGKREPGGYRYGPYARFWVEPDRIDEFERTSDIRRCIWAWRRHTEAALGDGSSLAPEQYHELRYESLVHHPTEEGDRLLHFLEIRGPRSRRFFQSALEGVKVDSVGRWQRQLSVGEVREMHAEAGDLLKGLGYVD